MGQVYRAVDTSTGVECAVKLVHARYAGDPRVLDTLKQEVRVSHGLSHPTLPKIHTFDVTPDGQPYVVMEYVDGEDLEVLRRRRGGRLPEAEVVSILRQVLEGLGVLHDAGRVHRDLKPSNVMVTSRGCVKILDYGISRTIQEQVRRGGADAAGTPAYMAPEQLRGQPCDARSDLYSLGMLALHLLAGRLPFDDSSEEEACAWHAGSSVPGVSRASSRMNRFLGRCLARRPENRHQSAAEALAALADAPDAGVRSAGPLRASRAPKRRRLALPMLAGILLVVGLAGFFALRGGSPSAPDAGGGSPRPELVVAGQILARPASGRAPLDVQFGFEGRGMVPATYLWEFGDGSRSTEAAPGHRFDVPGTYRVNLTAVAGDATWSGEAAVVVDKTLEAPRIEELFALPATGVAPLVVSFSARCEGVPDEYRWDFGDGTTAGGRSTAHAYPAAGTYRVVLTVSNEAGSHRMETVVTARKPEPVAPQRPALSVASIRADPQRGRAPLDVTFTPLTTGDAVAAFAWEFGDGATSDKPVPSHRFEQAGTYTITLRVRGVGGGLAESSVEVTAEGPRTWTLGLSSSADFRSLGAALKACGDEDTILVQPGEYRVGEQIEVDGLKGVSILAKEAPPVGSSPERFSTSLVGEQQMVIFTGCERLRVEGLRIETQPQQSQWNLLTFLSCNHSTVRNCAFLHGGLSFGGTQGRCVGGLVEHVRFQGARLDEHQNSTQALQLWRVDDFVVRQCVADTTVHSFYLTEVRSCRLENCRIASCHYGFYVADGSRQIHAVDCDFRGARDPHYEVFIGKALRGEVRLERTLGKITYD